MLGMKRQLSAKDLLERHNELVAAKRLQQRAEPPTIEEKRAQVERFYQGLGESPSQARRRWRLSRREQVATENDLSIDNAFNRMLIEASALTVLQEDFSWEELCAACFKADPVTFGMAGFPQWPDGSKVKIRLAHGKHLRNHQFIERTTIGRYRATASGMKRATHLQRTQK